MVFSMYIVLDCVENLLTNEEIDWLCKFLEGKGSNDDVIMKIVNITRKLQKMKRR